MIGLIKDLFWKFRINRLKARKDVLGLLAILKKDTQGLKHSQYQKNLAGNALLGLAEGAVGPVFEALKDHTLDDDVAVAILTTIGRPETLEPLIWIMRQPGLFKNHKESMVRALERIGGPEPELALKHMLEAGWGDYDVFITCYMALGRLVCEVPPSKKVLLGFINGMNKGRTTLEETLKKLQSMGGPGIARALEEILQTEHLHFELYIGAYLLLDRLGQRPTLPEQVLKDTLLFLEKGKFGLNPSIMNLLERLEPRPALVNDKLEEILSKMDGMDIDMGDYEKYRRKVFQLARSLKGLHEIKDKMGFLETLIGVECAQCHRVIPVETMEDMVLAGNLHKIDFMGIGPEKARLSQGKICPRCSSRQITIKFKYDLKSPRLNEF